MLRADFMWLQKAAQRATLIVPCMPVERCRLIATQPCTPQMPGYGGFLQSQFQQVGSTRCCWAVCASTALPSPRLWAWKEEQQC